MHAALISSLALASIAFAFPIETRDKGETFIKCDDQPYATGLLATVARTAYSDYENVYYGLDNSILATGADGNKDQVLVNTVNGGAYSATNATRFEFIKCTSTYLGTDQSNGIYGYLQPVEKTTNGLCLQAASGSVDTADQAIVAGVCSRADLKEQQYQTFQYTTKGKADSLEFTSSRLQSGAKQHPTYFLPTFSGNRGLRIDAGTPPTTDGPGVKSISFIKD